MHFRKRIRRLGKERIAKGKLKWSLGIYVLRDRSRRLLWLTLDAYIENIAKQYEIDLNGRLPVSRYSHG
jgi:hypothetical protein